MHEFKDQGHPDDKSKEEQYERLISDLKSLLEDHHAVSIDLLTRVHDLECHHCGADEELAPEGCCAVFTQEGEITDQEMFIIIDARQRTYYKEKHRHCFATYTFICPVCGVYQTSIQQDDLEDHL